MDQLDLKKVSCTISRNGDLVHRTYVKMIVTNKDNSDGGGELDIVGQQLIKEVSVEIGGQEIDKHYGTWIAIWQGLTHSVDKANALNSMQRKLNINDDGSSTSGTIIRAFLQFWFCRNPGLALRNCSNVMK